MCVFNRTHKFSYTLMARFNQESETRYSEWLCRAVVAMSAGARLLRGFSKLASSARWILEAKGQWKDFLGIFCSWDILGLQTQRYGVIGWNKHGKAEISENDTKADARTIEQARCQLWCLVQHHTGAKAETLHQTAGLGLVGKASCSLRDRLQWQVHHVGTTCFPSDSDLGWSAGEHGGIWLGAASASADQVSFFEQNFVQPSCLPKLEAYEALWWLWWTLCTRNLEQSLETWQIWQVFGDFTGLPQGILGCGIWTSRAVSALVEALGGLSSLKPESLTSLKNNLERPLLVQ